jgi:hypothetical protein
MTKYKQNFVFLPPDSLVYFHFDFILFIDPDNTFQSLAKITAPLVSKAKKCLGNTCYLTLIPICVLLA